MAEGDHAAEAGQRTSSTPRRSRSHSLTARSVLGVRGDADGERAQAAVDEEAVERARNGADRVLDEADLFVKLLVGADHGAADASE